MHVWVPEKDAHLGISQGCARTLGNGFELEEGRLR